MLAIININIKRNYLVLLIKLNLNQGRHFILNNIMTNMLKFLLISC